MQEIFDDIGFAKLDLSRRKRTGMDEAVFCPGKTKEQLLKIFQTFESRDIAVLGTRCSAEQFEFLQANGIRANYDPTSRLLTKRSTPAKKLPGHLAVCCAGTADLPIAEEAAQVAEFGGASVSRHFDVGIAGLHRLLSNIESIRKANVIIAVAGMEGALPGIIAGLVSAPVIAVPTSVGYGASFQGLAPLLTMINSCAEGVSVVNIDNGFGAGVLAMRILKQGDLHA